MKTDIHPEYVESSVRCSCGNTFLTHSTKAELQVELCNECHPFYTGRQKLMDTGGRVERFQRRVAKGRLHSAQRKRPSVYLNLPSIGRLQELHPKQLA